MATTGPRPRRELLTTAVGVVATLVGCTGDGGSGSPASPTTDTRTNSDTPSTMTEAFTFRTTAFDDGSTVPRTYTCTGADVSPPLSLSGLPSETESVAIVVDDPDAPGGTFTHWLLWNLPADTNSIPEDVPTSRAVSSLGGARQGTNDFGEVGYRGPCPPTGDPPHTYRFTAYAVSETLSLSPGAKKAALVEALEGVTVGTSRFTGEFARE